ncbi:MAG: hypothetical protein AMXMBFR64_34340 [Myxococcales bacterium]
MIRLTLVLALAPALAHAATCPDDMALAGDLCVDRWEASRADATAKSAGKSSEPPLSRPGVYPWTLLGHGAASAACASAGKRLCTFDELGMACSGLDGLTFPYGDVYVPGACNGASGGAGQVAVTGSFPGCESPAGVFDLSGNVQEWTASLSPSGKTCVFGGDYYAGELTVEQNVDSEACTPTLFACIAFEAPDEAVHTNIGFRCCAEPGVLVADPDAGPVGDVGGDAGSADAGEVDDAGSGGEDAASDVVLHTVDSQVAPDGGGGQDSITAPPTDAQPRLGPPMDAGTWVLDLVIGGAEDTGGEVPQGSVGSRGTSGGCSVGDPFGLPLLLIARRRRGRPKRLVAVITPRPRPPTRRAPRSPWRR